ncbi:MurR/RpiR family transcriptional regulator [Streptomyces sp. HC44]|uniref:MurR/RpiR family transcriptional regulator n=1 Tax=Streptomyces scabichelini TaxID=2711217 RepID=A0A6G4VH70_9ACTN|nr:MurR/RpiR family transcriptional regulator [Streptomyces scabichelini]NGO13154.1 MurR/RpiR family transcriptional regulator [Streptomyces scabichelini]
MPPSSPHGDTFEHRVSARLDDLKPAERRVAEFVLKRPREVLFATATDLGAATGTSDATVIRTARSLGYSGLPELKRHLARDLTDRTPPSARMAERIERTGTADGSLAHKVLGDGAEVLRETAALLDPDELDTAATAVAGARSVLSWGLGVSALAAEYAAVRLGRLGIVTRGARATGFQLADQLLPLTAEDTVLLYSPGRLSRDLEVVLDHAARTGADAVLVTSTLGPELRDRVRAVLQAPNSPTRLTGEILSATAVTDALVLAVAALVRDRATGTADLLDSLRSQLSGPGPA